MVPLKKLVKVSAASLLIQGELFLGTAKRGKKEERDESCTEHAL